MRTILNEVGGKLGGTAMERHRGFVLQPQLTERFYFNRRQTNLHHENRNSIWRITSLSVRSPHWVLLLVSDEIRQIDRSQGPPRIVFFVARIV